MSREEIQQKIVDLMKEIQKKQQQIYNLTRLRDKIDNYSTKIKA